MGALAWSGCRVQPAAQQQVATRGDAPEVEPAAPTLRRLTASQYRHSVLDLFGEDLALPENLDEDWESDGLYALGAAVVTTSPYGVEKYEDAAVVVAEQALDPDHRDRILSCVPEAAVDATCAEAFVREQARLLWRRPATEEEVGGLVDLANEAGRITGDFYEALRYPLEAMLQSPWFLYRVELGEEDPAREGGRRFTDWEMASRLSYFLWDSAPDEELLLAAEAGELTTDAGLTAQVDRMLEDSRARTGLRTFVDQLFTLYAVAEELKDPDLFPAWSSEVAASAAEQTLLDTEALVFDEDGDWREIFTSLHTHVDGPLAEIYGLTAPADGGFELVDLPDDGGRHGLLGMVSYLAQNAHPTTTSVTRRGLFIRGVLLCEVLPPPPPDVDTSIPEPDATSPTMRERIESHLTDPSCAACHTLTDPIGLGLENFDSAGVWRTTENGATIDPSGDLDGAYFADAWELGEVLAEDGRIDSCLTRKMFRAATGHSEEEGEEELLHWHTAGFVESGHRVLFLMRDLALSPAFREVGEVPEAVLE